MSTCYHLLSLIRIKKNLGNIKRDASNCCLKYQRCSSYDTRKSCFSGVSEPLSQWIARAFCNIQNLRTDGGIEPGSHCFIHSLFANNEHLCYTQSPVQMRSVSVSVQPKIYHIVHVDRLPSIIADEHLWCDAEMLRALITIPPTSVNFFATATCDK